MILREEIGSVINFSVGDALVYNKVKLIAGFVWNHKNRPNDPYIGDPHNNNSFNL